MSINHSLLVVHGLDVLVRRKNIKYLYLLVYPPDGQVRVSAPRHSDDEAIRLAVIPRLEWIYRHQQSAHQDRQSKQEMVSVESHYFAGRRYRLDVTVQLWHNYHDLLNAAPLAYANWEYERSCHCL